MNINYNKIRNGDYVEGLAKYRMPETPEIYKGIVFSVNLKENLLSIEDRTSRTIIIKFSDISYHVNVCKTVFNSLEEAEKIMKARDPRGDTFEIYDRRKKCPKRDRYKIVHKIGK